MSRPAENRSSESVYETMPGWFINNDTAFTGQQTMTEEEGAELENDKYKELYEKAQIVTGLFFYPTFCLFGLVGNGLSVFVLSRKRMRSATNAFLLALSISDIIKLLVDSVYFVDILLQITDRKTGEKTYAIVYPYAHYFFHMSVCTTAWLTVSVAAERYLIVIRSNRVCTVLRARLISVVVFLSTIVLMIPVGLRYRTNAVVETAGNLNATVLNVEVTELWRGKNICHRLHVARNPFPINNPVRYSLQFQLLHTTGVEKDQSSQRSSGNDVIACHSTDHFDAGVHHCRISGVSHARRHNVCFSRSGVPRC